MNHVKLIRAFSLLCLLCTLVGSGLLLFSDRSLNESAVLVFLFVGLLASWVASALKDHQKQLLTLETELRSLRENRANAGS